MAVPVSSFPQHRRMRAVIYGVVVVLHAVVIGALVWSAEHRPVRLASAGSTGGIEAYVSETVGTAGHAPTPVAKPKKAPSRIMHAAVSQPDDSAGSGQSQGAAGAQGVGTGPVRLGSGEGLTLLNKVVPIYPPTFRTARVPGTVVLDATIHQDGTIGDVRVLQATNDQFAQAAVTAVKQWKYSPIPYEGIVTVTVNFTVPH